jgi:hypothetical protein
MNTGVGIQMQEGLPDPRVQPKSKFPHIGFLFGKIGLTKNMAY